MSTGLHEITNPHLDYSHVYQHRHISKSTMISIRFMRLDRKHIDISISNQSSLYDLYTMIKLQCYKDVYKARESGPMFPFYSKRDYIPPDSSSQLYCIIRDLIVVNEKTQFLKIPIDPKNSLESFMVKNPGFFITKQNKYIIYVIDEKTIQEHQKPTPQQPSFIETIKSTLKKYTICKI